MSTAINWKADTTISLLLSHLEHCIAAKHLRLGRCLHARLLKAALTHHTLLANRLVDLYSKCGSLPCSHSAFLDLPFPNLHSFNTLLAALARDQIFSARQLFDQMPHRNVVTYNTMISGLTRNGYHAEALKIFTQMPKFDLFDAGMDKFTVVSVATACANLGSSKLLQQLHCVIIVSGLELDLIMSNAMIDAYGKCGEPDAAREVFDRMGTRDVISWTSLVVAYTWARRLDEARSVFDRMPEHNAVTWTALVSGYEQNGEPGLALELFEQMMSEGVSPTPYTVVSVLGACASLGLMAQGKQVHDFILRRCIGLDFFNIFVTNALLDMYAKCGDMASATALFDTMPERDFVSWNSMVTGFAQNGHGKQSLAFFERMVGAGVTPTHVTFLAVLSACSHAGLVSEARRILDSMKVEYKLCPRPEHYAAFIDALGRNRQFEEAVEFIESLASRGVLGSVGTWGALLGACRMHGNLELAKKVAETLFELEPENGARYVMLSNICAAAGRWDDVRRVRVLMKGKGLKKEPACSWIEVRNAKYMFMTDDKSHCQTEDTYGLLATLVDQMKEARVHLYGKQYQSRMHDEEEDLLL